MTSFTFIDLFAGIGGMRQAAEENGGRCVFSSEIDREARRAYADNFGDEPAGDITAIYEAEIPDHDVLLAGFPCQPFSKAGFTKGFEDTRGTLFFDILRIASRKKTPCLILENVKNLSEHDGGKTLSVIVSSLESLGYSVNVRVLNASEFALPQSRERTIIVASTAGRFDFDLVRENGRVPLSSILETSGPFEVVDPERYVLLEDTQVKVQKKTGLRFAGYIKQKLRVAGVRPNTEHLSRVHKQRNRVYCATGTHPTISAGETAGRFWILTDGVVRRMTLRECYRLQGFPDGFRIHGKSTSAYRQIGNSVPVPMIAEVVRAAVAQGLTKTTPSVANDDDRFSDLARVADGIPRAA